MDGAFPHRLAVAAALTLAIGCGDSSTTPTPTNRPPSAAVNTDPITLKTGAAFNTTVTLDGSFSQDPDGGSLSYRWEVPGGTFVEGTSAGDVVARVELSGAVPVTITLTVTDSHGAEASATRELALGTGLTKYVKNYVEALFLGSGPFAPSDGNIACVGTSHRWASFPEGTNVQVVMGSTVDFSMNGEDIREFMQAAVEDISYATNGYLDATYVVSEEPKPEPQTGQSVSWASEDPVTDGCLFERGCTRSWFEDMEPGERITLTYSWSPQKKSINPADAFVHDVIGHGLMGLCHIDQESIGGNPVSLMSGGPGAFSGLTADKLSEADMIATRAVYSAGLVAGARYAEFRAADLVN